jgi:hypothetical protein
VAFLEKYRQQDGGDQSAVEKAECGVQELQYSRSNGYDGTEQ